jgi:hypothetical protein
MNHQIDAVEWPSFDQKRHLQTSLGSPRACRNLKQEHHRLGRKELTISLGFKMRF